MVYILRKPTVDPFKVMWTSIAPDMKNREEKLNKAVNHDPIIQYLFNSSEK